MLTIEASEQTTPFAMDNEPSFVRRIFFFSFLFAGGRIRIGAF